MSQSVTKSSLPINVIQNMQCYSTYGLSWSAQLVLKPIITEYQKASFFQFNQPVVFETTGVWIKNADI